MKKTMLFFCMLTIALNGLHAAPEESNNEVNSPQLTDKKKEKKSIPYLTLTNNNVGSHVRDLEAQKTCPEPSGCAKITASVLFMSACAGLGVWVHMY